MSRTENAAKLVFWSYIGNIRGLILNFISRTFFIYCLGSTYLGISGLYSSILSVLSFAELGFGSAMTFAMYKPVADNDEDRILKLLRFYRTAHRFVAVVVTIAGLAILPFLQYIIQGADALTLSELRIYYLIYLTNSVVSYFISYTYCYIGALQKGYITANIDSIISIITVVLQILILVVTNSFLAYLLTQTILSIISKVFTFYYVKHKFPILGRKLNKTLSKEEQKPIFKEVRGLLVHRFSSIAVHSTDNIIISSLSGLGIKAVGWVSNYNLIMTSVLNFVTVLFNSLIAGFGNLAALDDGENYHKVFLEANFINFWIYGFCSIAFFVLIPPFITLWIGDQYLIDSVSFFLIVLNCYFQGQCTIYNNARIAKGNFSKDQWNAFTQAIVNLVVSIIGAHFWGLVGVYIGTICSRIVILIRPIKTYSFLFNRSAKEYYIHFFTYFVSVVATGIITYFIVDKILTTVTILRFAISVILVAIIPNIIFLLLFGKTRIFRDVYIRVKDFIVRRKNNAQ